MSIPKVKITLSVLLKTRKNWLLEKHFVVLRKERNIIALVVHNGKIREEDKGIGMGKEGTKAIVSKK